MRLCVLLASVLLLLPAFAPAQKDKKDKKKDSKEILKLFADEFVELTPGKGKFPASFEMGSSAKDAPDAEKPAFEVTFDRPFAIGKYEVTQELYEAVMGKNPAKWKGVRNSVEMLSWDDANTF